MSARRVGLLAPLACLCIAGCGTSSSTTTARSAVTTRSATTTVSVTPPPIRPPSAPTSPAHPKPRPDPCPPRSSRAPQTQTIPSRGSSCFHAVIRALWRGIRNDSPHTARYAFFPLRAYEQVKAIGDAAGDYTGRLLADYRLDLEAAHELLGAKPKAARLIRAIVPQRYIHWVPPGACYNALGYYEVPNSRLVYRIAGQVRSFGIASMISWRGNWYVVHLGAVLRSGEEGVVDDPSAGVGTPAPSGTC